jgi:hypothetical protein
MFTRICRKRRQQALDSHQALSTVAFLTHSGSDQISADQIGFALPHDDDFTTDLLGN